MTDLDSLKERAQAAIDAAHDRLVELSLKLHTHVELSLHEVNAAKWLSDVLESEGFRVQRGLGSLPTAFQASIGHAAGPRIGFLAEYDGLPVYGHSCGHNVVAAAAVGAGIGLKAVIEELEGTAVVLGTPAEEGPNGKWTMRDEGFFDNFDAVMLVYPGMDDIADSRVITPVRGDIEFFGKAAHAAARPELGVNALDALLMAFNALSLLRQQIPSDTRIHGIITKGGTLPMVIPDHTTATIMVRANTPERVAAVLPKVQACIAGAATATGCRVEQRWTSEIENELLSNKVLASRYGANLAAVGREPQPRDELSGAWSGDTSAISWLVPTIQPQIAMTDRNVPPHSHEFHAASATPAAARAIRDAAVVLARTAIELLGDPAILGAVQDEHAAAVTARHKVDSVY